MRVSRVRLTIRVMMFALIVAGASAGSGDLPAVGTSDQDEPMTVAASCVGRFAKGHSWYLSVNSAGEAELTIAARPQQTHRKFVVPRQKLMEVRRAVEDERFLELTDEHGERVADGSTKMVTVTVGQRSKSVKLLYLMNWVQNDKAKLREPSRAVRVLMLIRDWFDDADAVDLRRFDRMVLDAANQ